MRDNGGSGTVEEDREEGRDNGGSGTLEKEMKQNVDLAAMKPQQPPSNKGSLRSPGWVMSHFRAGSIVYLGRTCSSWHCSSTQGFLLSVRSSRIMSTPSESKLCSFDFYMVYIKHCSPTVT